MKVYYILGVLIFFMLVSCTDPEASKRILEANGFKNIKITGYNFFDCSKDDFYHTGFTATSPTGQQVSGTVCSGIVFKSHTIRFE